VRTDPYTALHIRKVIVDEHVRKHADITDDLILDLVRLLDGTEQAPDDVNGRYEYFASLLALKSKQYRLIWILEENQLYIGIITAYRDKRKK
jgi:hypothetical protein